MTNLIDFIMDLFRSPEVAAQFVANPDGTMRDAGFTNVSTAQLQAVAATAAPAGAMMGGGDPVVGLQRAVANHHSIASPFSPQNTFAPQTQTEFASRNNTDVASNNDVFSPDQSAGGNAQNGAFNLGFGDITLGDKTSNTATNGGVVVNGENDGDIVSGDGAVLGNNNDVNNGDISTGAGSNVNLGDGDIKDSGTTNTGSGDVIQGNEGPVINEVDMSGGNGGGASAGGGLLGGGEANGGGGGGGGNIILTDSHDTSVQGNQSNVEVGGDNTGKIDGSVTDVNDSGNTDNSVNNSGNVTNSGNTSDSFNETQQAPAGGGEDGDQGPLGTIGGIYDDAGSAIGDTLGL